MEVCESAKHIAQPWDGSYHQFQKQNFLLNNSKAKMLISGDSLVSNLSRYHEI